MKLSSTQEKKGEKKICEKKIITFEPVHAATTSWIVYGVTITIKPNEIAAIVLDVDPLKTLSCSTIWMLEK